MPRISVPDGLTRRSRRDTIIWAVRRGSPVLGYTSPKLSWWISGVLTLGFESEGRSTRGLTRDRPRDAYLDIKGNSRFDKTISHFLFYHNT